MQPRSRETSFLKFFHSRCSLHQSNFAVDFGMSAETNKRKNNKKIIQKIKNNNHKNNKNNNNNKKKKKKKKKAYQKDGIAESNPWPNEGGHKNRRPQLQCQSIKKKSLDKKKEKKEERRLTNFGCVQDLVFAIRCLYDLHLRVVGG